MYLWLDDFCFAYVSILNQNSNKTKKKESNKNNESTVKPLLMKTFHVNVCYYDSMLKICNEYSCLM